MPYLLVDVWSVCLQESHKVLVLEQHVLLDDGDVGLGLAQAGQLALQELTHLGGRGGVGGGGWKGTGGGKGRFDGVCVGGGANTKASSEVQGSARVECGKTDIW